MSTNSVVVPSTTTLCFCDSKSQGSSWWNKDLRLLPSVYEWVNVMRNSVECFAEEVAWQYPYKVRFPIHPFQPVMLGLHKRPCGFTFFFVGELIRSHERLRDFRTSGSSNLSTNFWKSLVMIFVSERGRRWLKLVKGDSFWIGVTLACFIDRNVAAMNDWTASWSPEWGAGRNLCTSNRKAHQDQRFCASSLLRETVYTSITGIRVPGGMGIGWGALYAVSVFISLRHWFIN